MDNKEVVEVSNRYRLLFNWRQTSEKFKLAMQIK
jgi:hypothetical protein